jgi:hypothetical protein
MHAPSTTFPLELDDCVFNKTEIIRIKISITPTTPKLTLASLQNDDIIKKDLLTKINSFLPT